MPSLIESDDVRSGRKAKAHNGWLRPATECQWVNKRNKNPNFAEFLAFLGLFWMDFPNLSQRDPSFGKFGHVINRKTYGPFIIFRTPLLALEEMLSEKR